MALSTVTVTAKVLALVAVSVAITLTLYVPATEAARNDRLPLASIVNSPASVPDRLQVAGSSAKY